MGQRCRAGSSVVERGAGGRGEARGARPGEPRGWYRRMRGKPDQAFARPGVGNIAAAKEIEPYGSSSRAAVLGPSCQDAVDVANSANRSVFATVLRLRQSRVQARPPSSCSGGLTRAVSAAIRPRTASRTKWKTCPALCRNLSNPPSLPLSSCVAFCVSPACPTTRSTASANMKRLFGAKCARSCLRLMPWIAANHRTEGAVSVSAAGKDCRSTVPSNVNLRARRSSGTAKFLRSMRAETMAKGALFNLGLLLLAACNDNGSSPATKPPSTVVPMNAQAWSNLYSPRMPPHPTPQTGGGWYFDFPTAPNSVHYVLAAVSIAASSSVDASILVTTTETPVFVYNLQPDNTCVYPAHVRFLL